MSRFSPIDKAQRVLLLLLGIEHAEVAVALTAHGFGECDREEGWRLLRNLKDASLDKRPTASRPLPHLVLDAWENRWFPVIQATLERHYPHVAEYVFLNVRQTRGIQVHFSVGQVVSRLRKLESEAPVADARAARDLLVRRGLTELVLREIEEQINAAWELPENAPCPGPAHDGEAAEAALWSWYLEWSRIVRAEVKDRRVLRALGFHAASKAARDSGDSEPLSQAS
jgi:hypothetical protein